MKAKKKNADIDNTKDALQVYLKDIRDGGLLNYEEEKMLSRRILHGDRVARQKLVNANLRLVVKIAKGYVSHNMDLLDLIQEGNLGLIKAAEKYDYRKNVRFSTYASFWIKQSIARAISNKERLIRLPHRKGEKLRKLTMVAGMLSRDRGKEPDMVDISKEMSVSLKEVHHILNLPDTVVSLEAHHASSERGTLHNVVTDTKYNPDSIVMRIYFREKAREMLNILTPKEKDVLLMRYSFFTGEHYTLKDVGKRLSMSPETVRQIELRALKKIREHFSHMKEFLEV